MECYFSFQESKVKPTRLLLNKGGIYTVIISICYKEFDFGDYHHDPTTSLYPKFVDDLGFDNT